MRFNLLSCKRFISRNTGKEYYKAIIFDYLYDVITTIFINQETFSFMNENHLVGNCVDDYLLFKYDIEKQAYVLVFDINK